ncbi:MAG: hypothetical protein ACYTFZ_05365 [Planctomycetota bacterium]|jgi:hypothetical protein
MSVEELGEVFPQLVVTCESADVSEYMVRSRGSRPDQHLHFYFKRGKLDKWATHSKKR